METVIKEKQTWTVMKLIEWSASFLTDKGVEEGRLNSELLLCHVLQCRRIDLYLRFDMVLSVDELSAYKSCLNRRISHEPMQYIVGSTDFMGIRFEVDRRVLIPRQETEILVEQVITHIKNHPSQICRILDIGTGSGCIAVSLAEFLPDVIIDAVDSSQEALDVAKINIDNHRLSTRISLIHSDFLKDNFFDRSYDIIVSNPPYISKSEFEIVQDEVRKFEPQMANTDFADGLTFFKAIANKGKQLLIQRGCIFVEMAYNQNENVRNIFHNAGYVNIESFQDYNKIERVIKAEWK